MIEAIDCQLHDFGILPSEDELFDCLHNLNMFDSGYTGVMRINGRLFLFSEGLPMPMIPIYCNDVRKFREAVDNYNNRANAKRMLFYMLKVLVEDIEEATHDLELQEMAIDIFPDEQDRYEERIEAIENKRRQDIIMKSQIEKKINEIDVEEVVDIRDEISLIHAIDFSALSDFDEMMLERLDEIPESEGSLYDWERSFEEKLSDKQ